MTIVGVLAVVALPRFSSTSTAYDDFRLYDETVAALRFAQRSATAMQRTVCVTFDVTNRQLSLTYATTYGSASCTPTLPPPGGTGGATSYVVTAQGAAVYSGATNLSFDRVGRPSVPQTITIGSRTITIETETGYVR